MELLEIYWAVAKIGAVVVPLSTLLQGKGLAALLQNSDTTTVITSQVFVEALEAIKLDLPAISADRYILTGDGAAGYRNYPELTAAASDEDPQGVEISGADPYNIIYSSGTTGLPKGGGDGGRGEGDA